MKKNIKTPVLALLYALALASCEEVIDVDLNATNPRFVIQGNVTDQPGGFTVSIRKTVNFDEPNAYPAVSNATVTISDGSETFPLLETAPGRYQTAQTAPGVPGRTYQLRVEAEGEVFEARSLLPAIVPFDTLLQSSIAFGAKPRTTLVPVYDEPPGMGNYYRFRQWKGDTLLEDINVRDDRLDDGLKHITQPIFSLDKAFGAGDTATVEMQTIDRSIYKYFFALAASAGNGPGGSVPGNPVSNISGGAVGYFSAHTVQRRRLVIR